MSVFGLDIEVLVHRVGHHCSAMSAKDERNVYTRNNPFISEC